MLTADMLTAATAVEIDEIYRRDMGWVERWQVSCDGYTIEIARIERPPGFTPLIPSTHPRWNVYNRRVGYVGKVSHDGADGPSYDARTLDALLATINADLAKGYDLASFSRPRPPASFLRRTRNAFARPWRAPGSPPDMRNSAYDEMATHKK